MNRKILDIPATLQLETEKGYLGFSARLLNRKYDTYTLGTHGSPGSTIHETTHTYDRAGRLKTAAYQKPGGTLHAFSYRYCAPSEAWYLLRGASPRRKSPKGGSCGGPELATRFVVSLAGLGSYHLMRLHTDAGIIDMIEAPGITLAVLQMEPLKQG